MRKITPICIIFVKIILIFTLKNFLLCFMVRSLNILTGIISQKIYKYIVLVMDVRCARQWGCRSGVPVGHLTLEYTNPIIQSNVCLCSIGNNI